MSGVDRFAELVGGSSGSSSSSGSDIEAGVNPIFAAAPTTSSEMRRDFFFDVSRVKGVMEAMKGNVSRLVSLHREALIDPHGGSARKQEIEELTRDTNAMGAQVRNQLRELDAELGAMLAKDAEAEQQSAYKIKRNMHATLTKKFLAQMQDYSDAQTSYKRRVEETARRQFRIVKPDATPEEVEKVLADGSDSIFKDSMLACTSHSARAALTHVQEKHQECQRLESSITELAQLFQDLSLLVDAQGEILDDIEYNVSLSKDKNEKGLAELVLANEYAAKARKRTCCLILVFVIVAVWIGLQSGLFSVSRSGAGPVDGAVPGT